MAGGRGQLVDRVARAIAAARRARGLSQEGLASVLDIAVKNVQRIESGKQNLSLVTIERICRALEIAPETLFAPEKPGASPKLPSALRTLEQAGFQVRRATERGRRSPGAVPVMTLQAAAGHLSGAAKAVELLGWAHGPRDTSVPPDQFVAEIRGASMEPRIPDGSVALFGPAGALTRGRVVLVSHASLEDEELGGPYALKKIGTVRALRNGRRRVTLTSYNPEYAPIVLEVASGELRIVAELVRVLATPSPDDRPSPGE